VASVATSAFSHHTRQFRVVGWIELKIEPEASWITRAVSQPVGPHPAGTGVYVPVRHAPTPPLAVVPGQVEWGNHIVGVRDVDVMAVLTRCLNWARVYVSLAANFA